LAVRNITQLAEKMIKNGKISSVEATYPPFIRKALSHMVDQGLIKINHVKGRGNAYKTELMATSINQIANYKLKVNAQIEAFNSYLTTKYIPGEDYHKQETPKL
jgi:hypothetical protein